MPSSTRHEPGHDPAAPAISRRGLLTTAAGAAGAVALAPLLSACGNNGGNGGTSTKSGIDAILPTYVAQTAGPKPSYPAVAGVNGSLTNPGFLGYPTDQVKTVSAIPGSGGTFKAVGPSWNPIPAANNSYYQAVDKALGANFDTQPANGNTYSTAIPPLIAAKKLPDWLQIPTWLNATFNTGELCANQFADLTPYLSGDNIKKYPNLAAIPTGGWQSGVWQNKLYGIPSYTDGQGFAGMVFYRKDMLQAKGITPEVKSTDDLTALGKEVNNPSGNVWAFDALFTYLQQVFKVPTNNFYIEGGKVHSSWQHPQMLELLSYCNSIAKMGLVHPQALANVNTSSPSRFQSGQVYIEGNGTGSWNTSDAQTGIKSAPGYTRWGFPVFSSDGSTPTIGMGASSGWVSYLNKRLSAAQIQEALAISDYLAAPYGSYEYTLINFGVKGVDFTMTSAGPQLTTAGNNTAADNIYNFFGSPQATVYNAGYPSITTGYCDWMANAGKYTYKPAFWNLNVTVPNQYSTAAAGTQLTDAMVSVWSGQQPVSYYQNALSTWESTGGTALLGWYQKNVVDKGLS